MFTKIVLDVLLFDGTRGLVSNQLSKSVYSHCVVLKLKLKSLKSEKQWNCVSFYCHKHSPWQHILMPPSNWYLRLS